MKRKILYSPGYGAGWTTWNTSPQELRNYLLTYQPIIDYLESGKTFKDGDEETHYLLRQLLAECDQLFDSTPYLGGARDLRVLEVTGRVRIEEYDGSESVEEEGSFSEWM